MEKGLVQAAEFDKQLWRKFKATAVLMDLTISEALEEAVRLWLEVRD